MKINQALKQSGKPVESRTPEDIFFITGGIRPEADGKTFRFYQNPDDPRSYLVLKTEDVIGDVLSLNETEKAQKGFSGESIFRLGVKFGTKVRAIRASTQVLGETISADMSRAPGAAGGCKYTSGCTTSCCTYGNDGLCYCDYCCYA